MERRIGKAAGGMEEQLGGWKSTRKDGKAAGGAVEEQPERWKSSWKGGKAIGGWQNSQGKWWWCRSSGKATRGLEKLPVEGVGRGRNGEIAGKMEKQPVCVYVCVREKNQAERWKSSQKDGKAAAGGGGEWKSSREGRKAHGGGGGMEEQLGRVGMEKRAERWKSSREGGKASGGMEEHLGRWKSSRKGGKAAGGRE